MGGYEEAGRKRKRTWRGMRGGRKWKGEELWVSESSPECRGWCSVPLPAPPAAGRGWFFVWSIETKVNMEGLRGRRVERGRDREEKREEER